MRQFRDFVIRNFLFESVEGLSMGWLASKDRIFIRRFADCLMSQSKLVVIHAYLYPYLYPGSYVCCEYPHSVTSFILLRF